MSEGRKAKRILAAVWENGQDKRYVPRALQPAIDHSWGVWDKKDEQWIEGSALLRIDPDEPAALN